MKTYKGFKKTANGKLMCRNMEYEIGKTYKYDGEIELCYRGYHTCHELYQVWYYYPNNGNNVFYEVECGGKMIESEDGSGKFVCSEITLIKDVDASKVAKFDEAYGFHDGCAAVRLNGKYNFISTEGRLLSNQWFNHVGNFSDGFARVRLNNKRNFINTDGRMLSDLWFDNGYDFRNGFAIVELNDKWNFINKKGEFISSKWFDYCCSIDKKGMATVLYNGKLVNIDMSDNIIS